MAAIMVFQTEPLPIDQDLEQIERELVWLFQEHIKLSAEISELECQLDMKRSILSRYRLRS